jgi:hypothetical protein
MQLRQSRKVGTGTRYGIVTMTDVIKVKHKVPKNYLI